MKAKVILKPGKEKAIKNRHHWIFSGAIAEMSDFKDGDILPVFSSKNEQLGSAYFNRNAKIIGRMIAFDGADPYDSLRQNLERAFSLRSSLFQSQQTNAYRLINAEGDCLPGLIVDKYGEVLVMQISTLGMEKLRDFILELLVRQFKPLGIFEKSLLPSRKEEKLMDRQELLYGTIPDEIEIAENALRFLVSVKEGQKTGFFLDHREMRQLIKSLSSGKRVLNCFAYTGGFSVYAASGGAKRVDSVDISQGAMAMAKRNMELNEFNAEANFIVADVFDFLRKDALDYEVVILDPPAFAKRQKDVVPACRGYKDINRLAMQKMPPKTFLLTCSCSYYVDEDLFQKVLFQASVEAKRSVKIISRHHMAADHPINLCHPESDYLKSFLLYVE